MITKFLPKGQVWKRVWILKVWTGFGQVWSGFGEPGGTPSQRIPRRTPPREWSIPVMYGKHRGKLTLSPYQSNPISCNTLTGSSGIIWTSSSFLSPLSRSTKRLHNATIKTKKPRVTTRQISSKWSSNSALAISLRYVFLEILSVHSRLRACSKTTS